MDRPGSRGGARAWVFEGGWVFVSVSLSGGV